MKIRFILIVALSVLSMTIDAQTVISRIVSEGNKSYLEVDSVPFPILGAQIRVDALMNCDSLPIEQIEQYFVKAKDLGVNTVQVPVWWKNIEISEDVYSFSTVNSLLEYTNRYGLKMELLWFSSNMVGESFSYFVPDYILLDEKKLKRDHDGWFWNYYGYQYNLILDDEWILEREAKAVTALFNHIYAWDQANGNHHPVITAQIHNEPDVFPRWRRSQLNIGYRDDSPLTNEGAWQMMLNALDSVGQAVKNSSYKVATRTNLVTFTGTDEYPEISGGGPMDVFNLEGIDFISYDPYKESIDIIKSNTLSFSNVSGNYPLVAENKGTYENTASLILAAVSLGSGYDIYDLATSKFYIDNATSGNEGYIDHGVYTWDLQEKTHTKSVQAIFRGLKAASPIVATARPANFLAFNVEADNPQQNIIQQLSTTNVGIDFSTSTGAIAFAIDDLQGHLYIYCTKESNFVLSNAILGDAKIGYFDSEGIFHISSDVNLLYGNTLSADEELLYRIEYTVSKQEYLILNFANEAETNNIISHLHTHDWQTNPAYSRNLYADNSDFNINKTSKCATFSGYNSDNEWWYGLDFVLENKIDIEPKMQYLHVMAKTSDDNVDTNRGLIFLDENGQEAGETWFTVTENWMDYVIPVPSSLGNIKELRFMLNHKADIVTLLDEIIISNDPAPRSIVESPPVIVLDFENETETDSIIAHLHTHDWQTNPAYSRNLYADNIDLNINESSKCAAFSGYYSDSEWWYGLDFVLENKIDIEPEMQYLHVMIKTSNDNVDTNRGLIFLDENGQEAGETWFTVTENWKDYVIPVPSELGNIKELRFMLNHKANVVTSLDEIILNNNPAPRTLIYEKSASITNSNVKANNTFVYPNPANKENFNLRLGDEFKNEKITLRLVSVSGRVVYGGEIIAHTSDVKISNINNIDNGVYVLLVSSNKESKSIKVIF